MQYEINVAKKVTENADKFFGPYYVHLFCTKPLDCLRESADKVYAEICERFPAPEYRVTMYSWERIGSQVRESCKMVRAAWPFAFEAIKEMMADNIPTQMHHLFDQDAMADEVWHEHFDVLDKVAKKLRGLTGKMCGVTDPEFVSEPALEVFLNGEHESQQAVTKWLDDQMADEMGSRANDLLNELFDGELHELFVRS